MNNKHYIRKMQDLFYQFADFLKGAFFAFRCEDNKEKMDLLRQYAVQYIVEVIPDVFQKVYFDILAEVAGTTGVA